MNKAIYKPVTTAGQRGFQTVLGISIHALRVEGDGVTVDANSLSFGISIHALRVEGDLCRP